MSRVLKKYENELHKRCIGVFKANILEGRLGLANPKFHSNGNVKPFYGLTCIAWVDKRSGLYKKLGDLQKIFRKQFNKAQLEHIFSFLAPESFHMTICDIEAGSLPLSAQHIETQIEKVKLAFKQIKTPLIVTSQIQGIGLDIGITALVRFDRETELVKILDMERLIKLSTRVDARSFMGHINLAYFVQQPRTKIKLIKEILLPYENKVISDFSFAKFDLVYFSNMNNYQPILTLDLRDGKLIHHQNEQE
ncbi:MAG: DUF1868 domain-containing protein [Candidatus Marinimicrobia bacterium]|nr:DUF1868 domain-containing protein [Candidatus Neomarinimicrobiota bacterium]